MAMKQNENEEKIYVRERLTDNVLDLSLMNISSVPVQEIKPLRRATVLDLSNNRISIIESNFTDLTQLTQIDLSKNRITSICDDFGLLTNLRRLDLYKNQLTRLPLTFGRLKNLKYLDLKENPLNPAFKKLIGTCSDTNDCLVAATRAVEFMKQVERRVMDDRAKERKVREERQRQLDEDRQRLQKEKATEEEKPVDEQKADKAKRKRKQAGAQGETINCDDAKAKTTSKAKAKTNQGGTKQNAAAASGFRHSSILWLLMLLLLAGTYMLYTKYNDVLQMAREGTVRETREAILEEYIK
uniref:Leucine-rich repeat-containing protein 59 n=1 Tax=Anopheles epiroticus TaxID=199890 RepID=A0A182P3J3_9DIPT